MLDRLPVLGQPAPHALDQLPRIPLTRFRRHFIKPVLEGSADVDLLSFLPPLGLLTSGMLAKHTDRVFADLRGPQPGVPDGMKVDVEGNVYCGGAGGIWVMDPTGKKLGRIVHGAPATTNLAFGGADWRTLYITSRNHLGAVKVKIPGIAVPVAAK